ncbi:hypothetical protein LKMONMHP_4436 [Methylobacterium organophilum]|uniref:Uncharacterized protein n=1 Tax=Methylobacterium organophilum TaxID=410 RepID=A0ABQ4TFP2_METOR|nr:hypothetical protein LKMONMHP_4436 [Methylobacterium organophilum]
MPRWLEIGLTLLVFTAAMTVFGWGLEATVPQLHDWLLERTGHAGVWGVLLVFFAVCAVAAWSGHRKPNGRT